MNSIVPPSAVAGFSWSGLASNWTGGGCTIGQALVPSEDMRLLMSLHLLPFKVEILPANFGIKPRQLCSAVILILDKKITFIKLKSFLYILELSR